MSDLDLAALRKLADAVKQAPNRAYRCVAENALSDAVADAECGIVDALLDAAEERDRLRSQRDALLAALEPIVWQLESAQRSTAPAFLKGFTMNDTESGALLRAIAAAKETP